MAQAARRLQLVGDDGTVLAEIPLDRRDTEHPFSSGKVGFFASDKVRLRSVAGEYDTRHQLTCSIVEIMPKADAK